VDQGRSLSKGFSAPLLSSALEDAPSRFASGDSTGAVRDLDLAYIVAVGIFGSMDPAARYTANTADVAAQGAAVTHTGLHDAARSANEVDATRKRSLCWIGRSKRSSPQSQCVDFRFMSLTPRSA
jgi:hypothetical protein